jgi:hypothetical protein
VRKQAGRVDGLLKFRFANREKNHSLSIAGRAVARRAEVACRGGQRFFISNPQATVRLSIQIRQAAGLVLLGFWSGRRRSACGNFNRLANLQLLRVLNFIGLLDLFDRHAVLFRNLS